MLISGPDTRVVELRVHGVQGTTPQTLVDAVAAVDVAGDGLGRIVRPADRLRRPAPGPVLQAEGRPVTRVVEGYLWGGMTSGGWSKATWALLFPFCMANVAHWMLPPVRERSTSAHLLGIALRSLLRLAALLLTVLLIAQVAVISLDLVAAQCLAPGAPCLDGVVPGVVRTAPWLRTVVGLLPIALTIVVLARVSSVDWRIERKEEPDDNPNRLTAGLPAAHMATDPDTPALRVLHIVAALGTGTAIALGGPLGPIVAPGALGVLIAVVWVLALALVGGSALAAMLLDDPTGDTPHRGGRWLRATLGPRVRRGLLIGSAALLAIAAAALHQLPARLPGADAGVQMVAALLVLVCVLLGLLLVPAALLARRTWASLPRELRPWAGGWMAAPVLVVAGLLGGGFGAGIALAVRQLIGGSRLVLPIGYGYITVLWGVAGVLALLAAICVAATTGLVRWSSLRRGKEWAREASLLHAGRARDLKQASRAWWWARWERNHSHHVFLISAAVLVTGAVPASVLRLRQLELPGWTRPFSTLGVAALAVLAVALLRGVPGGTAAAVRAQAGDHGRHRVVLAP